MRKMGWFGVYCVCLFCGPSNAGRQIFHTINAYQLQIFFTINNPSPVAQTVDIEFIGTGDIGYCCPPSGNLSNCSAIVCNGPIGTDFFTGSCTLNSRCQNNSANRVIPAGEALTFSLNTGYRASTNGLNPQSGSYVRISVEEDTGFLTASILNYHYRNGAQSFTVEHIRGGDEF